MAIEHGRRNLQEQAAIADAARGMFIAGIDLLRSHGHQTKNIWLFKRTAFTYTEDSQPPVNVAIDSGRNLDKANSVWISISGLETLKVSKMRIKNQDYYSVEKYRDRYARFGYQATLTRAEEFRASLRDISKILSS